MYSLINFFTQIITRIYNILNVRIFADFPLTYIHTILTAIALTYIFKFIFGGFNFGFKLADRFTVKSVKVSTQMANTERKKQINNNDG